MVLVSADLLISMNLFIQLLGCKSKGISISLLQAYAHVTSSEKIKESMTLGILYNGEIPSDRWKMERIVLLDAEGYGCGTDLNREVMGWFFLPGGRMRFSVNVMPKEYMMMKVRRKESPKPPNVRCDLLQRAGFQPENRPRGRAAAGNVIAVISLWTRTRTPRVTSSG